jgi:hypothetical protein
VRSSKLLWLNFPAGLLINGIAKKCSVHPTEVRSDDALVGFLPSGIEDVQPHLDLIHIDGPAFEVHANCALDGLAVAVVGIAQG